ncbi:class I SAM-dependent methyltransferase [Solihabitans fulvus]|uniref:Class I SAM-dependent methyltransferase n=1 Tax=Solihabitans fulvus TaxID=1892852 RepID=A0A5B2WKJ2_9PSEU|nr:class I SAM-dependent methyltransferase [Solihabitans fulvus]KAA2250939.1 class I SAM-dependent methyltransferase [Solihabitans fulvus]
MAVEQQLDRHESIVSSFYGSFPYPWRPMYFDVVSDPDFYGDLIRQETGRRDLATFDDIWVAGCGTNQALITALQFPQASVLGTDVSEQSLAICAENARKLGVTNLRLVQQGIAQADYAQAFDLVICTGVIHHNPDPVRCLARLSAALRSHGVLELMVYNKFHRREKSAFQEALRILLPGEERDHHERLSFARSLADSIQVESTLSTYLSDSANRPEASWVDSWMNPCEQSYDVDALWAMAEQCGLTVDAPKVNQFDRGRNQFLWTLDLTDEKLLREFFSLDDRARWQVVNLLHMNSSPMLWFYLRPAGERVSEADRNRIFLDSVLARPTATRQRHVLNGDGEYELNSHVFEFQKWAPEPEVRAVWDAADGTKTGREIFAEIGRGEDFNSVHRARVMLTSVEFPHLTMRS